MKMTDPARALRFALFASAAALSSCGGGGSGGSSSAPPPAAGNAVPLVVDGGPVVNGALTGTINQAYVTITVCVPGTTNCQQIDHVWVDTGSTGLRIIPTTITSQLPLAPPATAGQTLANCVQFISAYSWGAMRTADIKIGGETASSVPIQVIGDTAGGAVPASASAPTSCSNGSQSLNTEAELGANALLGVGVFLQDCGLGCETNTNPIPPGFYYNCAAGSCQPTNMPVASQLQNPVGLFAADNNGVLIQMPGVAATGASVATGSLIFGIGTQSNNGLGSATVFLADPQFGLIKTTTTYGDLSEPSSFIDSGSNGWFFDDATIAQCSSASFKGFYCPSPSPVARSATMLPYNTTATSFTYSFSVADISSPSINGNALVNDGGPSGTCTTTTCTCPSTGCSFDWGFPFFYGRSVFTAIEAKQIGPNLGPFFAATTP